MRLVVLDSTALSGVVKGPGSPAYFSRYLIEHLRSGGHEVTILESFDERVCAVADAVWTEWCNTEAYEAAASGVCRKLVIRLRGFDVWGPLDKLQWQNVDALVCESEFLGALLAERLEDDTPRCSCPIIPSGVDVANIPFRVRGPGPVVALAARGVADKGFQLAFEWARQRPDIQLHVALANPEPRLERYLHSTRPGNVTIHGQVDTVKWLNEIDANFLLSASNWETLGYTIAEAMAMGIMPLIHDTPGAMENWPPSLIMPWTGFAELNYRVDAERYSSIECRHFIEKTLDAAKQSKKFADLLLTPSTRDTTKALEIRGREHYEYANRVFGVLRTASERLIDMNAVEELVTDFRSRLDPHSLASTQRYGAAMATAVAFYNHDDLARAELWAARAMLDFARPDAMALLGEVASLRGDTEEAVQWFKAACAVDDTPHRYRWADLVNNRHQRLAELQKSLVVDLPATALPEKFIVVVTVRNAEPWIARCLKSIQVQAFSNFTCYVVDDVSADRTSQIIDAFCKRDDRFRLIQNTERKWQARNTVEVPRRVSISPEDVIVLIDGDDWLSTPIAFTELRVAYSKGAWLTYGQLVESDGHPTRFGVYPKRIAEEGDFADWVWCATPPRSFKRFLLDELKNEDFQIDGEWPKLSGDICVIMPMMQLACERAVGITTPIYSYNVETPDSEHKTDPLAQTHVRDLFLRRPKKARLEGRGCMFYPCDTNGVFCRGEVQETVREDGESIVSRCCAHTRDVRNS